MSSLGFFPHRRLATIAALLTLVVGFGMGCQPATFLCASDADCDNGTCESSGYCSFKDEVCPSGRRYGEAAGDGLGNRCVPEAEETDDSGASVGDDAPTSSGGPASSSVSSESGDSAPEPPETTEGSSSSSASTSGSDGSRDDESTGVATSSAECGNGVIERDEECDFGTVGDATCVALGMDGGELRCAPDCTFDLSACEFCGNGVVEAGEVCDGSISGVGCSELAFEASGSASISCSDTCDEILVEGCGEFVCDADPILTFGDCPPQCDECGIEGACVFHCSAEDSCAGETIQCPPGRDCGITCNGPGSCTGVTVRSDDIYRVDVGCSGQNACGDVEVDCADGVGQCFLNCLDQPTGVCTGAHVTCGFDDCGVKCDDATMVGATVDCQAACGCELCGLPG